MKRLILFCFLGFLVLNINAQIIEKTYQFDDPEIAITGDYHLLSFKNTLNTGITGEPVLPYQAVKLLLPPGYIAESITVTGAKITAIEGNYTLYPKQASRPLSEGESNSFTINSEVYNTDATYPQALKGRLSTEFMNGYAIALSTITPVIYNPFTGELAYYKELQVSIKIRQDIIAEEALKNLSSIKSNYDMIRNFCQNPELTDQYPARDSRTDDYHMLIITDESFEDDFEDLIETYIPRGIITEVVTVQDINANGTGQDSQEKIRNYIKQEYQDHGVEYFLLGGDVEHVPYRGFYCYVESGSGYESNNIPADLYYSALDGTWNDDGDNSWGEIGEDDLLPDVSVARMSFSNQSELNKMLNKTISYQDEPVTGELDQPLLAGEHLWSDPISWGADYLELLIGYQNENGYETTGIPEEDNYDTLYDRNASWNKNQLLAEINEGKSFIHHSGHANATYVMRFGMSDITNSNFYAVNGTDHNYTLVYTHGCICGAFDESDCIAEKMAKIDNFLVAGGFNSRYGWFNEGQTEGPSVHLHREFVDALYDKEKSRIGETHKISKIETSPWVNAPGQHEEGALRWCFYDCNILGDPALGIWTNEPLDLYVVYPSTIHIGDGSFNVNVSSNGTPLEGYNCVFMNDDNEIYGMSTTDESGNATIVYDPAGVSLGSANLVISGYNCLPEYYDIEIIPDEGAYVVYESDLLNDEAGNGNGLADYSELIYLTLDMNNAGLADAEEVDVFVSISDEYITFSDTAEFYGNIPAGQTVSITDGFCFQVADSIPDQHIVNAEVEAIGQDNWISEFEITLQAPFLEIGDMVINDDIGGNGNGIPDPGETIIIEIISMNNGHSDCFNTNGTLSTTSLYVSIEEDTFEIGELLQGNSAVAAFTVTIDESTPIGESIDLDYLLESGVYAANIIFYPTIGIVDEDFETGDFSSFNWEFAGDAPWVISSDDPFEGVYSAKSGDIGHEASSELYITMNVLSAGDLSFNRKVSSEIDYDYLRFYIDDLLLDEWSGEEDWEEFSYEVAEGEHTFKWSYEKDIYVTGGSDCAWVDYIVFPPVSLITDIPEFEQIDLIVYPNPVSDYLNIAFTLKQPENINISLFDISGRILSNQNLHNIQTGNHIERLDVSRLVDGVYYLKISMDGEQTIVEKLIITQ